MSALVTTQVLTFRPPTPPPSDIVSYRFRTSSSASASLSPAPSQSSISSSRSSASNAKSDSNSSVTSGRSRSLFSFASTRYSPYSRVEVKVERDEDAVEELKDVREVKMEGLSLGKAGFAHGSISPEEAIATPRLRPRFSTSHANRHPSSAQANHRRAYSMSQISYGFMFFPPTSPSTPPRGGSRTFPLSASLSPPPSSLKKFTPVAAQQGRARHARTMSSVSQHRVRFASPTFDIPSKPHIEPSVRTSRPKYWTEMSSCTGTAQRKPNSTATPHLSPSPIIKSSHTEAKSTAVPRPKTTSVRKSALKPTPSPSLSLPSSQPPERRSTTPESSKDGRRLVFVNPQIALHLQQGGIVSIRSVDGQNGFRVCLPAPSHSPTPITIHAARGTAGLGFHARSGSQGSMQKAGSVSMSRSAGMSAPIASLRKSPCRCAL